MKPFDDPSKLGGDMQKKRMGICLKCPLYSRKNGGICNQKLWLNPVTGDVSTKPKAGYHRGCNCVLAWKTKSATSACPAGKW